MTQSIRNGAGVFLLSIMVAGADQKTVEVETKDAEADRKWVSLAPSKEGMGPWKALNFGGEGDTTWNAVSYTHLTLPTILLV